MGISTEAIRSLEMQYLKCGVVSLQRVQIIKFIIMIPEPQHNFGLTFVKQISNDSILYRRAKNMEYFYSTFSHLFSHFIFFQKKVS